MSFPSDPLPVTTEIWTGSWQDITAYVFARGGSGISAWSGYPNEGNFPEPSSMTFGLNNRDGRFSPRNPTSPYYGLIGRNTPVRVRIGDNIAGVPYLAIEGTAATDRITTADAAALDITGDLDVRIDAAYDTWAGTVLCGKYDPDLGDERSWAFAVTSNGNLSFAWSADGSSSIVSRTSTVAAGLVDGERKALRVTFDADTGTGFHRVTFYTADTIAGPWTQLGSAVNGSDPAAIFASAAALEVGRVAAFGTGSTGKVYAFELRDGIDGSVVAAPEFTADLVDPYGETDPFTDDAGREWTLNGETRIHDPGIRGVLEISEWPTRWDPSEQDVETSVTAQGILRRLGQGKTPTKSTAYRYITQYAGVAPAAYWPLDTFFAERGGQRARQLFADIELESSPGELAPWLEKGLASEWRGALELHLTTVAGGEVDDNGNQIAPVTHAAVDWVMRLYPPIRDDTTVSFTAGLQQDSSLGGAVPLVSFVVDDGVPRIDLFDPGAPSIDDTTDVNAFDNALHAYRLEAQDTGTITVVRFYMDGELLLTATTNIEDFNSVVGAEFTGAADGSIGYTIGHVAIWTDTLPPVADVHAAMLGYEGEQAHERIERVLGEIGIPVRVIGTESTMLGPQPSASPVEVVIDAARADMGLLYETRDALGLTYRTLRGGLYNRPVAFTLDYAAPGEVAPDLAPVEDDQLLRNRITVRRTGNGEQSAVAELTTGPLSTQDPPAGVGVYDEEVELNLHKSVPLDDVAHWRLHLGTTLPLDPHQRYMLALHEAGHIIVALAIDAPIAYSTLTAGPGIAGTLVRNLDPWGDTLVAAGGPAADFGRAKHDLAAIARLGFAHRLDEAIAKARAVIRRNQPATVEIAKALAERGYLSAADIHDLVEVVPRNRR